VLLPKGEILSLSTSHCDGWNRRSRLPCAGFSNGFNRSSVGVGAYTASVESSSSQLATIQSSSQHFLLQEQRVAYASEFVCNLKIDAVEKRHFGVLLSGPNGVGKSSIGLLAF
jgi:hypothetical protein